MFAAAISLVLCIPITACWEYQGTWSYVEPPDWDEALDGTWYWWWNALASIYGDPYELSADGWAEGGTGIDIDPSRSLEEGVFAWSMGIGG